MYTSYLSEKLEGRVLQGKGKHGVFARDFVMAGELLVVWGGEILTSSALSQTSIAPQHFSIQIDENLYLLPSQPGPADWVNHSCFPNTGIRGQISLIAMFDIAKGDEISFDYAMSDSSPYDEFKCECGASNCRKYITGDDWKSPELWSRYDGFFSSYLQARIDKMRRTI